MMEEFKLFAVINDWQNIEFVFAQSEIEATQFVLHTDQIEKLNLAEVEKGARNIEALCHEISLESILTFNYARPDLDLITTALLYEKTECYGVLERVIH